MPEQSKFENMDLFASLEAIMKQNTGFYQSDLDIDKEIIAKAAASPNREDKTLLWFCRPSGTHCFRERDVFLKDTAPHNTWRFYMEQTSDRVLGLAQCVMPPWRFPQLLCQLPCFCVYDSFMGVLEDQPFLRRIHDGRFILVGLLVGTEIHRMPHILRLGENLPHDIAAPVIGI